jgi:hypothetical protein
MMNVGKLKGPEKMLQMSGKCKLWEHKSKVLLTTLHYIASCDAIADDVITASILKKKLYKEMRH